MLHAGGSPGIATPGCGDGDVERQAVGARGDRVAQHELARYEAAHAVGDHGETPESILLLQLGERLVEVPAHTREPRSRGVVVEPRLEALAVELLDERGEDDRGA